MEENDVLAQRLQELVSRYTGGEPSGLDRQFVVSVTQDRAFAQGTAVSAIQARFALHRSGLLVPAELAAGPAPIDDTWVYLTADEVFGFAPDFSNVAVWLQMWAVEDIMVFAAECISVVRSHGGAERGEIERQLVNTWFQEPYRSRLANLLAADRTVLLAPQVLSVLMRLALLSLPTVLKNRFQRGCILS